MNNKDIKNELEAWAKETVKAYNQFCLSYYTQSPLNLIEKDNIELLVLGINPGSESVPFDDWSWRNQKCPNGLSYDVFLLGNPPFQEMIDGKIKAWSYWNKLCNILNEAGLKDKVNDQRSFVLTNIYYGSTKKAKEIKGFNELKDHAFKLIDILKPKRIICLGQKVMDVVLEEYVDKNERDCFVEDLPIRYKLIPVRNEENHYMKVFGFHHPAYPYTRQEKQLVSKFLEYYDNNEFDPKNPLPTEELKDSAVKYRIRKAKKLNPDVINLEQQINTQGARQYVWKGSTIVYEFYTDKNPKTNEFKESNNMIVIDLVLLGNNKYEINIFTRNNNCEQTKEIATGIFGSYNPNTNDPSRHLYAEIQTEDQKVIVDKMNELLSKVRSYRDEHFQ